VTESSKDDIAPLYIGGLERAVALSEDDFVFCHLKTEEDIEQYLELTRIVFRPEEDVDVFVRNLIDYHPTMTLSDHFVIKHRGKIVSCLNLIPVKWSIGGVPLKVAEMGNVATLPEYRHRGLIRRLVAEFHKRVADKGYDLSVIAGIPYFYRQFGYEYAIPIDEETRIKIDQIPDYEPKHNIRPFNDEDIPKAMQLLKQTQQKFYVHSIRDEKIWRMQQKTLMASDPPRFEGYAVEGNEDIVAYFRIVDKPKDKELVLREVTDTDQLTARSILRFLKDTGKKRGHETLATMASHHDSFTEHIVSVGGMKQIPSYAWQIRVTDYVKIFKKMKPLFEKRLATSTYWHLIEKLYFNFRHYTVQMTVEDGKIIDVQRLETNEDRTIGLNPLVFTQLLLGHRSRQELEAIYPDFRIRPSHKHLIDVLFPKLPSYIHAVY